MAIEVDVNGNGAIDIAFGGTNAKTLAQAKVNLEIPDKEDYVLLDATSGSATITTLNKIYYIDGHASSQTVITIPDAVTGNASDKLRIYKKSGNEIKIVTATGTDLIGGYVDQFIHNDYEGYSFISDGMNWLKTQDSTHEHSEIVTTTYDTTADWHATRYAILTTSGDIAVTLPLEATLQDKWRNTRDVTFVNIGNNTAYIDLNGNQGTGKPQNYALYGPGALLQARWSGSSLMIRDKVKAVENIVPSDLSNLELWLEPFDRTTITKTGTLIDTLNDKSGNANHFTGTTTTRPNVNTDGINTDKDSILFTATQLLNAGNISLTDNTRGFTIIALIKPSANGDYFFSKYASGQAQYYVGTSRSRLYQEIDGTPYSSISIGVEHGTWQFISLSWSPGEGMKAYINKIFAGAGNAVTSIEAGIADVILGDPENLAGYLGEIGFIACYSDAKSFNEIDTIIDYAAGKTGITNLIPSASTIPLWERNDDTNTITPETDNDNLNLGSGTFNAGDTNITALGIGMEPTDGLIQIAGAGGIIDAVPVMTSNTTPSGIAYSDVDSNDAWFLFDKDINTRIFNGSVTLPCEISYQFPTSKIITKYALTAFGSDSMSLRMPGAWDFQGWTGSAWVTLDSQTAQVFTSAEVKTYSFSNTTEYIKYRLNITTLNYNDDIIMAAFDLWESTTSAERCKLTTDYKLGLGNPSPIRHFDAISLNKEAGIRLDNTNNNYWDILNTDIETDNKNDLQFKNQTTNNVVTFKQDGHVGINTIEPQKLNSTIFTNETILQVKSETNPAYLILNASMGTSNNAGILFNNSAYSVNSRTIGIINRSTRLHFMTFNDDMSPKDYLISIKNTGNTGIGTLSANTKLEVAGQHVTNVGLINIDSEDDAYMSLDALNSSNLSGLYFKESGSIQFTVEYDGPNNRFVFKNTTKDLMYFLDNGSTQFGAVNTGININLNASNTGLITAYNLSPADPSNSTISDGANFGLNGAATNFYGIGLGAIRDSAYDIWFQTGAMNGGGYRFYNGVDELFTITKDGKVGIGTQSPTELLDINSDAIRIRTSQTPASATATGVQGTVCWDADFLYICVGVNNWKRSPLAIW